MGIAKQMRFAAGRRKFILTIENMPRNTTKKEWKNISRYLRIAQRIIQNKIDWRKLNKEAISAICYGIGVYETDHGRS